MDRKLIIESTQSLKVLFCFSASFVCARKRREPDVVFHPADAFTEIIF